MVFLFSLIQKEKTMKIYQVNITGMTCVHCVMAVKKELETSDFGLA